MTLQELLQFKHPIFLAPMQVLPRRNLQPKCVMLAA